ncbi:MAG: NAD(P)/FAD-dependent oxidoreductase [Actinomycetota bacterium]
MDYDAIVIGAGLGGLSCAAMLAQKGLKTLVCENTSRVGGCCSSYDHEGYRFDIGASVVELEWVIDELFERMGKKTSDFIDFIPIDPIYGFITADGRRFSYPVDVAGTREVIASLSEEDARAWDRFAKVSSEAVRKAFGNVMAKPMATMRNMVKVGMENPALMKFMKYFVLNFESTLCSFFKNDTVRASMSLQSYFIGLPPALCPGYVAFLAYSEHEGVFYPRGGMIAIPQGIARACEDFGGEIRFNATVKRVLLDGRRACGVELEDGTQIRSRMVVSNINAKTLYLELVGEENLPTWAKRAIKSYEVSMPSPMIMLGLDTRPDLDAHHTIPYSTLDNMNSIWFDEYLNNRIPAFGAGLISWPTHADPSLAPEGHHILNMIAFAPYEPSEGDWDVIKEPYLEKQLDVLERNFGLNLRDHVVTARVNTPKDFERMLRHPRGAVYGLQSDVTCSAAFRPGTRSRAVKGLYLTGASTHLGGGIAPTIGSGVVAGDLIEKDFS